MEDIVDIYKEVLSGNRKKFPPHTWNPHLSGFDNSRRCLRYLIYEKLYLSTKSDILNCVTLEFLKTWKLIGAVTYVFNTSPFPYFAFSFPELNLKPWELKVVPKDTWNQDTVIQSVRWMISEQLKWNRCDILERLNYRTFSNYNLSSLVHKYYDNIYDLVYLAYPEYNFKIWEFNFIQLNDDHKLQCLKCLIEEKLQFSYEDIKNKLTINHFKNNGLKKFMDTYFDNSPYKAISFLYPDHDWSSLKHSAHGERSGSSKLTSDEVSLIRNLYNQGYKINELSERFIMSYDAIANIIKGRHWKERTDDKN